MTTLGITGHQGIPESARPYIESAITEVIRSSPEPIVGWSCLAGGADQMFASVILKHGGELHVLLPSAKYEQSFTSAQDLDLFAQLMAQASTVDRLDHSEPSEDAFYAAGRAVVIHADIVIAVWDGKPAGGLGGTADVVDFARRQGKDLRIIWPAGVER